MAPFRPLVLDGSEPSSRPRADVSYAPGVQVYDLTDPALRAYMLQGDMTAAGAPVNAHTALSNTAVFRSVSLISYAIGMLPLQLIDEATKEKAASHPLYRLLLREPNNWQTASDFWSLSQS